MKSKPEDVKWDPVFGYTNSLLLCCSNLRLWRNYKLKGRTYNYVSAGLWACKLVQFCFSKVSLPTRQAFRNSHSSKLQQNAILVKNYITIFLLPLFKWKILFNRRAGTAVSIKVCFHDVFKVLNNIFYHKFMNGGKAFKLSDSLTMC